MKIVSYIKDSFQEYEGQQSLVLFSKGCNFHCSYCYNYEEVTSPKNTEDALLILKREINPMHDAVVFLGGEPTIWGNSLVESCRWVKSRGLKTKLYTNASNVSVIETLLQLKLLDAISIDLKTVESDFSAVIGGVLDLHSYLEQFKTLVSLCVAEGIIIEIRTTKYKSLNVYSVKKFIKTYFPTVKHIITNDFRENLQKV